MSDSETTTTRHQLTDDELIAFLGLELADFSDPEHKARFMEKIADKRPTYERMHELTVELQLYEKGLAPMPTGVLVDWDKKRGIRR